jgi:glycerophosphoryl diester phosphodiesterase
MTAVFAHRGYTDGFSENTVPAFAEARLRGADGVELDVRRSRDGALVVHHDAAVAEAGLICELAVAELPESVPLLADALAACHGMVVNVEIKNLPGDPGFEPDQAIARDVVAEVYDAGWQDRVVVSSFNRHTVEAVRGADDAVATGWLLEYAADPVAALSEAASLGFSALHPFVTGVTAELVERAHALGLAVNTWTVNHPADLQQMVALDVDAVITDRLEAALDAVRGVGPPP